MSEAAAKTGLVHPEVFEATLAVSDGIHGLGDTVIPAAEDALLHEAKPGDPIWAGKTLSHFRLMRQLGEGAMGLVIQAQDLHLGRLVALKVLRKRIEGLDEARRVEQFLREARAAGRLDHPNVARVYEINEHKGWWYIATELLEGGTLHDVVHAAGPLPTMRACPIIADAAAGLAAAHQAGMIHRDIKPSNLMLTRTGRCKVVDFGLVRVEDPDDPFDFTQQAVGTPHYMAPEVIRRQAATPFADVYGLAAVLFFSLTGKPPFVGKTIHDVLRLHLKAPRPDARDSCLMCPESLAKLIQRAMAIEPEERPNAAAFALALRAESIGADVAHDPLAIEASSGSSILLDALTHSGPARSSVGIGDSAVRVPSSDRSSTIFSATVRNAWDTLPRIAAMAVLMVMVAVGIWWGVSKWGGDEVVAVQTTVADRIAFAARFPEAAQSYGLHVSGIVPWPVDSRTQCPVASWVGQVTPAPGMMFVAARQGRRYFAINDQRAAMITADQLVTYPSAEDAQADGKVQGW